MMKRIAVISIVILLLQSANVFGIPAFPGAEGAGANATGGRGGIINIVTTLVDDTSYPYTAGTIRWALQNGFPNPRIVVFRVGGVIELGTALSIGNAVGNITIAGQTAPGDGICFKGRPLTIGGQNVIVRHIRVRLGDENTSNMDTIHINTTASDVILDHCSASWSNDETLSIDSGADNITVQWCIVSESLFMSTHPEGRHARGSLLYGCCDKIYSFHHNIYAHHNKRSPWSSGGKSYLEDPNGLFFDWRNNVIYNWGDYAEIIIGRERVAKLNAVGNYYLQGSDSLTDKAYRVESVYSKGYFSGNMMDGNEPGDQWTLVNFVDFNETQKTAFKQASPIPMSGVAVTTTDADTALLQVLARAGCTVPDRDAVDERIVDDVIDLTGQIIDCDEAGDFYHNAGTAIAATTNTITVESGFDGGYPAPGPFEFEEGIVDYKLEILSGTGAGQIRTITDFNMVTDIATVDPNWTTIPDSNSGYALRIDCSKNAGGWPTIASGTAPTDSDNDGMPNEWELPRGLDPNSNDSAGDRDGDGYTNIEEYINYLADRGGEPFGDIDSDRDVDFNDLDMMVYDWLDNDCNNPVGGKLDFDCEVDFKDYSTLAEDWLVDELGL